MHVTIEFAASACKWVVRYGLKSEMYLPQSYTYSVLMSHSLVAMVLCAALHRDHISTQ